ncbi:MAG TPA: TolC family protein [Acidobacteriaceae bacterium]|jgi:outer membrane protein TolC|nr:TolC family protein [Acidobacteriaceae bacterium]
MHRRSRIAAVLVLTSAGLSSSAQLSLTSAVDLALKSNPRVRVAAADVNKASAALAESRDAYVPALNAGNGLGYSYGYPLGQPSVVNVTLQSVLLSWSQRDYIRAAQAALQAATLTLNDARAGVEQDTVVTYLALNRDLAREQALNDELTHASQLVNIVADRLNAGVDTALDLTQAKLTAAQTHLALLNAQDETAVDQVRLAHLIGLPLARIATIAGSVPALAAPTAAPELVLPEGPAVAAAFANAKSKQEIAWADAHKVHRPEVYFAAQYSLFAKFNNYALFFPINPVTGKSVFQYNNAGIGISVNWPIFDPVRKQQARESDAEAVHALAEAEIARDKEQEGHTQLARSTAELSAKADVAELQQQLAQQQLDAIRIQLQPGAATAAGPQRTPKDQANAEIDESARLVDLLNARFDLQQAQVELLRQQGLLDGWLRAAAASPTVNTTP